MIKSPTANRPKIVHAVYEIATSLIEPDPAQPRKEFDPEYIAGLGESIRAEGLRQPVTVRANRAKSGYYLIVTGECRWRAHCHAGIQSVRCVIATDCDDEPKRFRTQVVENMARRNMTLREEANAAKKMTDLGDSDETIASAIGYSVYRMRNIREMVKLSDPIWKLIESGAIVSGIAEFVMGAVVEDDHEALLLRIAGKGRKQAAAIVDGYLFDLKQNEFSLACDQAGVSAKKPSMTRQLAVQLMQIATAVAELTPANQRQLAAMIGADVAKLVPATKATKRGALFIQNVMNRVDTEIGAEKK
jgi:ParB/RepB/Spo0J family partition protein